MTQLNDSVFNLAREINGVHPVVATAIDDDQRNDNSNLVGVTNDAKKEIYPPKKRSRKETSTDQREAISSWGDVHKPAPEIVGRLRTDAGIPLAQLTSISQRSLF